MRRLITALTIVARRYPGTSVFIVCIATRVAALGWFAPAGTNYYWEYAEGLLHHGWLGINGPSTYLEPVYPAFLAAARWLTGERPAAVLLLQIAIAAAGGVALVGLASRVANNPRVGLVTGLMYACYPYLVRQSVAYLEVTLVTTLVIVASWQYSRIENSRGAARAGLWLGVAILARSSMAPLAPLLVVMLALQRRWTQAIALALGAAVMLTPWMVRNERVGGTPFTTRAGENLFVSTNRYTAAVLPGYDVDLLVPYAYEVIGLEIAAPTTPHVNRLIDRIFLRHAVQFAREHPWRTVRLKLTNALFVFVPRLTPFYEKSDATRAVFERGELRIEHTVRRSWVHEAAHAMAYGAILALAAVGAYRRRDRLRDDGVLLAVLATVVTSNVVFFTTTRLATPMVFVVMFYAACAISAPTAPRQP